MTDRQLLDLITAHQSGCRQAADRVIRELEDTVEAISRRYFFPGADHDDVVQLGRVGVFSGMRAFRLDRHRNGVRGFLLFCAERQIIAGLKAAGRTKHMVLSRAVPLDAPLMNPREDPGMTYHDYVAGPAPAPDETLGCREELRRLVSFVNHHLTAVERAALLTVVNGDPYVDDKMVDNGMQRARRKLRAAMAA